MVLEETLRLIRLAVNEFEKFGEMGLEERQELWAAELVGKRENGKKILKCFPSFGLNLHRLQMIDLSRI